MPIVHHTPAEVMAEEDAAAHARAARLVKLSPNDPALIALNQIAEALGPHSREAQLRILASVCAQLGEVEHARGFLDALEYERNSRPRKPPATAPDPLPYSGEPRD